MTHVEPWPLPPLAGYMLRPVLVLTAESIIDLFCLQDSVVWTEFSSKRSQNVNSSNGARTPTAAGGWKTRDACDGLRSCFSMRALGIPGACPSSVSERRAGANLDDPS